MDKKAESFSIKNLLQMALGIILFLVLLFGIILLFRGLTSGS